MKINIQRVRLAKKKNTPNILTINLIRQMAITFLIEAI